MQQFKPHRVYQLTIVCMLCLLSGIMASAGADNAPRPFNWSDNFHLYLDARHGYTDNIFYTTEDEESDIWLSVSPGLWFATPAENQIPLRINTAPLYSSGTPFYEAEPPAVDKHRIYLRYQPTLDIFADNDSEDTTHHLLEGLFQYRFARGLQFSIIDRIDDTRERWNRGIDNRAKDYFANLFQVKALMADDVYYHIHFNYANYRVDFKDRIDDFRDRTDNRFGLYYGLKYSPKKILFAEYTIIQSTYEKDTVKNNQDRRGAFGVDWKDTLNTSGRLNIGLQMQSFDPRDLRMVTLIFWELLVDAELTSQNHLRFSTVRHLVETDVPGPDYIESTHAEIAYRWQFSTPVALELSGTYTRDLYLEDKISLDGQTELLENTIYEFTPRLVWQISSDLELSGSYQYQNRESNFDSLDYTANIIMVSVNYKL